MKPFTIGEVARRAGVGVETVRFYERQGLLAEPDRKASGYRQYGAEAVSVLRFIRRAKQLGFTLKEIQGLLALRLDAAATRADVRRQARAKLADVEEKIRDRGGCATPCSGWWTPATARGRRPGARS
jgi:DNA-binding transcriptional MerR regulator